MKKIIKNELTWGVTVMASIGNGKVLVGNNSGEISLWQYFRSESLTHIRVYISGYTEVWEINSGDCKMTLEGESMWHHIDSAVVLTNSLLVVSGYCSPAWGCFDVWDIDSGECIYEQQQLCHRPHGMSLATTGQGFLVASGDCSGEIHVWQIDRSECKVISEGEIDRIYSMATLPTGEIVTGNHDLHFYKISYDGGICKYKTIQNGNVIDVIYPVGDYKLVAIDRSGTITLWNYLSEDYEVLGNSSIGAEVPTGHIVLERESAILSLGENKIIISEGIFDFPKQIAEIRKNARILSQAYRTGTSFFANLPKEILLNIAALTANDISQCDKIAQNYFSKP